MDLASRQVLGWSMGDRHDAGLVIDALDAAVAHRGSGPMDSTIFHSDRGAEGGFKWSSQHLEDEGVAGGSQRGAADQHGRAQADAVAGASAAGAACGARVLAGHR